MWEWALSVPRLWEWALSVPGPQLRDDGCAQMRLEGADHRGSLSALAVGLHFWGEKGQKGAVAQPARRVWLCVLGVTAGGTGIGITHVVLWGCSMGHPQLTKGRDHLHPTAAGTQGLLGSVECLEPWEEEIWEHCLGCSLTAEVLRMPQGKSAPVNPWHSCPDPS